MQLCVAFSYIMVWGIAIVPRVRMHFLTVIHFLVVPREAEGRQSIESLTEYEL